MAEPDDQLRPLQQERGDFHLLRQFLTAGSKNCPVGQMLAINKFLRLLCTSAESFGRSFVCSEGDVYLKINI